MCYKKLLLLIILQMGILYLGNAQPGSKKASADTVLKVQMSLSALGVESDSYPSIEAVIDLRTGYAKCTKSYYNPAYKNSVYYLTKTAIRQIDLLLNRCKLSSLKTAYTCNMSDQPTSTTTIYTRHATYVIKDYGLLADEPLKQLYQLVYHIEYEE